jgi:hypothetical protein
MAANKSAPIACTLTPSEFKSRATWIQQLTDKALLAHHIDDATAHLLYRPEAKDAVEQLVRQEQACCGFLQFEMVQTAAGIAVTINAPNEARGDAAPLFAHLLPSDPVQSNATVPPQASGCHCGTSCGT